jgi:hypothetical protein
MDALYAPLEPAKLLLNYAPPRFLIRVVRYPKGRRRHGIQMMKYSETTLHHFLYNSIYRLCTLFLHLIISHHATRTNNITSNRQSSPR